MMGCRTLRKLYCVSLKGYFRVGSCVALAALLAIVPAAMFAADSQTPPAKISGMVWGKRGNWHVNGGSNGLRLGDAVLPGSLLTASAGKGEQSTTILLPDGQRLLCECYDPQTCAQGFRVPAIVPLPSTAIWEMFARVQNVLLSLPATAEAAFPAPVGHEALAARAEIVSVVNTEGQVSIIAALRVLPSGQYALLISHDRSADSAETGPGEQTPEQTLDWVAPQGTANVRVPGPGLYRIRVVDKTMEPRIAIEVLATPPSSLANESAGLQQARQTILQWTHTHEGWPLHDFLRVYLQSRDR
jgi:hypothetical protein